MIRTIPKQVRPLVGLLSLVAYVLPAFVSGLSGAGHTVQHLLEEAREQRRVAATLGLAHASTGDASSPSSVRAKAPPNSGFIHTHGGVVHTHGGAVGELLVAADEPQPATPAAPSVLTELAQHVSPGLLAEVAVLTPEWPPTPHTSPRPTGEISSPPLPPPRA